MKIYTPVKGFNGKRASVEFRNGVGETDNPDLIAWFKSKGYGLEDTSEPKKKLRRKREDND